MFIKTRTETCIKGWDWTCRLRSLRGGPVLRARGHGMGPRSPAHSTARWRALLRSLCGLQRTQTSTQSKHRNRSLSLSSDQEHIKCGARSNIFEWFAKGTAQNYIRNGMVKFGVDRSCFGAWNDRFCKGSGARSGIRDLVVIISWEGRGLFVISRNLWTKLEGSRVYLELCFYVEGFTWN